MTRCPGGRRLAVDQSVHPQTVGASRRSRPARSPATRLRPASRAANGLRGRDSTSALVPCSTTRPPVEHDDAVREQQRVERVVGDHDRGPVGQHPPQRLSQRRQHGDVERRHRLVEQQQRRLGGQRPRHGDPLRLAARELRRASARPARPTPTSSSQCWASRRAVAARRTGAARPERDVLQGVEVGEQQRLLAEQGGTPLVRRHPDARTPGPDVGEHPAVEHHPPGVRLRPARR